MGQAESNPCKSFLNSFNLPSSDIHIKKNLMSIAQTKARGLDIFSDTQSQKTRDPNLQRPKQMWHPPYRAWGPQTGNLKPFDDPAKPNAPEMPEALAACLRPELAEVLDLQGLLQKPEQLPTLFHRVP